MLAFTTPLITAFNPVFKAVSQEITAPAPSPEAAQPAQPADAGQGQLQIGDFTLGDLDCPSLTGHPDIRY
ncbi:hypothetical protein [Hymenobacter edaphi]|uniref:hypothetical protein n=1 Tax=Hymenobacter edaphi TaxID=2211146 RepID=UPI0010577A8D|nr:hypothetical protein [Hymenobacter edaphi]